VLAAFLRSGCLELRGYLEILSLVLSDLSGNVRPLAGSVEVSRAKASRRKQRRTMFRFFSVWLFRA
jgi:hypothetical protein